MELYAIRHGESVANQKGAYGGWAQVPLTEEGRRQAADLGERIRGVCFDAVFSSDLLRTRQTTEIALPGISYEVTDRLREIHVGFLEGKTVEEARREFGDACGCFRETYDFTGVGGESEEDVRRRTAGFMEELRSFPDGAKIAVVCHHGTIAAMLSHVLGYKIARDLAMLDNCSVTCFSCKEGKWALNRWNIL